ncbi:MAG: FAD-dependent oxidoreductase [Verrucomicrobiota bacterium JB022]|nr:FAD-dependent oxidoreductase [Verrucomicrobiota bacterium JB022]
MAREFDYVVIGGGSAGYAAARTAREKYERVAIIDDAEELGGLCILRGCMPSKTLIYSAEVLHLAKQADKFALKIPEAAVDMKAMLKRKRTMVDEFQSYRKGQLQSDKYTLIRDRASFTGPNTVKLKKSGEEIQGRHFMIATGSVNNVPPIPGLKEADAWTSDEVLELDFLPQSVTVLGGGVIACELAQYLHRIGCKVTMIQRSHLILKDHTEEAAREIMKVFREEGIDLYTDTHCTEVSTGKDGYTVCFDHEGKQKRITSERLVNALGRRPAIDGLNLEAAGVKLKPSKHIDVNDYFQTSNECIYAAGDVTGPFEIVHLAVLQGEIAAKHAIGVATQPLDYRHRTSVTFTDPQVASVGPLPYEPECEGLDLVESTYPFNDHGKSILMHADHGYVRVWAERPSGRLIGAECVGKDAGELIHSMAVAVTLGATAAQLLQVQWYHPTLSEIWTYPLEEVLDQCG